MVQRIAALLIVVFVFSLPASAQDTSARAAADEYLTVVGTETVFPRLKSEILDRMLQLEPFQRPEARDTLERIAETSFDPEIIRSKILDRVEADLTAEEIQPAIDDNKTEFGQKMVAMEKAASTVETRRYLTQHWKQILEKYDTDPEKTDAVLEIMDVTETLERTTKTAKTAALTVIGVRMKSVPAEQRPPMDVVASKIDEAIAKEQPNLLKLLLADYLFTYRSASTEDLQRYLDILKGNRMVSDVFYNALDEVANVQLEEFLTEVYAQTDLDPETSYKTSK
ncbi:hypothetical protein K1W69_20340 [Hoeflea sp. WL0058]|uniref:DUF2059 domain-containing protein n=1 Tax=Flavimaribacter sediminis TaxID=2865987 RepID=A0AAE2ZS79_9HYPH|nr:hypothetical protein [Flavimaribacter sediminis]MBW8639553.1 hypothetical protein [Flavimaribacter sediminis]